MKELIKSMESVIEYLTQQEFDHYEETFGELPEDFTSADVDETHVFYHIKRVSELLEEIKEYGTKNEGAIFYIDESKLNKKTLEQLCNYVEFWRRIYEQD